MTDIIRPLKKVLLAIIAVAAFMFTGKAFGADSYSAFFTKSYISTSELASDFETGKVALVKNVDTLTFINLQLSNWNQQLSDRKVLKTDGKIFQLSSNFSSMSTARPYFVNILRNHCADNAGGWANGAFTLSRVNKSTGIIANDWVRASKPGEVFADLDPNTFNEVSQSDGNPSVAGFSLMCGNKMFAKVQTPTPTITYTPPGPISPGYQEVVYKPIPNPYDAPVNN